MRLAGCVGNRSSTSLRYAYGSCPLSRAECTRLMTAAARLPARRVPANSQLLRPSAIGRIWFSTQLLSIGRVAVVEEARQRRPAIQAVVDRLGGRRAVGHLLALQRQPLVQRIGDRSCSCSCRIALALVRIELVHLALDVVELHEELQRLPRRAGSCG